MLGLSHKKLNWDSDFFGVAVGSADIHPEVDAAALEGALPTLPYDVMYVFDHSQDLKIASVLQGQGARQVEVRIVYSRTVRAAEPIVGVSRLRPPLTDAVLELAIASSQFSRFRQDRRFADHVDRLYSEWIRKSLQGEFDDSVLGVHLPSGNGAQSSCLAGIVSVRNESGRGKIGILAVHDRFRQRGVGKSLIAVADTWFSENGARELVVVTQGSNRAAQRLYESCGYQCVRRIPIYHYWREN